MKILYDHQSFEGRAGGIARYFSELMRRSAGLFEFELSLEYADSVYLLDDPATFPGLRRLTREPAAWEAWLQFRGGRRLLKWYNKWHDKPRRRQNRDRSQETVRHGHYDLLHPTYYDPYFLDLIGDRPFVLTVYDMIHELFPQFFRKNDPTGPHKRLLAERAARIVAISECTKRDLVRLYGVAPEKVDVVHLAGSLQPSPNPVTEWKWPPRYLLFTGMRRSYKNFETFVRAVAPRLRADADLHLICTGNRFEFDEWRLLDDLGIRHKTTQTFVDDATLAELYARAAAFVFPSLYEGFGFPVLEAFACGCPALLSNTGSLPEIGGEAALYFDPNNVESIAFAVDQILDDPDCRERFIESGRQRNALFTWEQTVRKTVDVYKTVLSPDASSAASP